MNFLNNLDLLSVAVAIAGIGILGFSVYFRNRNSDTNNNFFVFSLFAILWSVLNYISYQVTNPLVGIFIIRLVLIAALWMAYSLFEFFTVFPKEKVLENRRKNFFIVSYVFIVSLITFSPVTVKDISTLTPAGTVATFTKGMGIFLFGMTVLFFILAGIFNLLKKTLKTNGNERKQYMYILCGFVVTFFLLVVFNFVFPAVLNNARYVPLGALFILPLIVCTFYAIQSGFLNIKVFSTSILIFILSIATFLEIIFSTGLILIIFRTSIFLLVLSFGIFLIKNVVKEVEQREKIEKQEKEMEIINTKLGAANERLKELDKQKSEFIGFASHQLRSPLTAIKGYASLVLEGDYGEISEDLRHAAQIIFESANTLVTVVADYLNVSSIELGQMKYDFQVFNLMDLAKSVIEELKQNVEKKGLKLEFECDASKTYFVKADREKIKQVFMNIIDNSAKYTPKGGVKVSLAKNSFGKILFAVKDTGIGISKNTIPKLFAKFIRAKNANETNIRGTGLGLFIAKEIITAHEGRIWVESEGEGKGSQFYVELNEKKS